MPNLNGVHSGKVILGIRPEDCHIADQGNMTASVYGLEPTGDVTYLTLKAGEKLVEVKADRDYRSELNSTVTVAFDTSRCYLFDAETGQRLR